MKFASRICRRSRVAIAVALGAMICTAKVKGITPNEWRFRQTIDVPASGLVRVNLPAETLDVARQNLEDLRILKADGTEVPYFVQRGSPPAESVLRAKEFRAEIERAATRLIIVTGTTSPLRAVTVETPGTSEFIKPVRIEGSHDGKQWRQLADGQPVFRMPGGAMKLTVSFPKATWEFLRLTIDDSRTTPIPFTGAVLESAGSEPAVEPMPITLKSRDESPGHTRIAVNLGGTNLMPAFLRIETSEPLFTREITIAVPAVTGDDIIEQPIATAVVYRIDVNGKNESHLDIPIETQIRARELLLLVTNGDSPPLNISGVGGQRYAVHLMFLARDAGRYVLLSGNRQCAAPNYDLPTLAAELKRAAAMELRPSSLSAVPDYKPTDNLAVLSLTGATIDVGPWKFRKRVELSGSGAQQLELDSDVLARATRDLRDVRVVRDGRQIPFVLERTSISRAIPLPQTSEKDPQKPTVSKWSLKLSRPGIPITHIACAAAPGIFQRDMRLLENPADERGDTHLRLLGSVTWRQMPNQKAHDFVIELNTAPVTDTLMLETDNGDNPPIELSGFRAYYPVTRVIFEAVPDSTQPTWFYYGNPDAAAPRYDVNLVAGQLLAAERVPAVLAIEEKLKSISNRVGDTLTGSARYIFWGVLVIAVVALLLLISRLLPKVE
jgi:hypothetical protein